MGLFCHEREDSSDVPLFRGEEGSITIGGIALNWHQMWSYDHTCIPEGIRVIRLHVDKERGER